MDELQGRRVPGPTSSRADEFQGRRVPGSTSSRVYAVDSTTSSRVYEFPDVLCRSGAPPASPPPRPRLARGSSLCARGCHAMARALLLDHPYHHHVDHHITTMSTTMSTTMHVELSPPYRLRTASSAPSAQAQAEAHALNVVGDPPPRLTAVRGPPAHCGTVGYPTLWRGAPSLPLAPLPPAGLCLSRPR